MVEQPYVMLDSFSDVRSITVGGHCTCFFAGVRGRCLAGARYVPSPTLHGFGTVLSTSIVTLGNKVEHDTGG